jgi:hypothetical protein
VFGPEPQETFILAEPPVVATVDESGKTEDWLKTRFAKKLWSLLLASTGRHLRTTNRQRSHPPIKVQQETEPLLSDLQRLCVEHGFRARDTHDAPVPSRALPQRRVGECAERRPHAVCRILSTGLVHEQSEASFVVGRQWGRLVFGEFDRVTPGRPVDEFERNILAVPRYDCSFSSHFRDSRAVAPRRR